MSRFHIHFPTMVGVSVFWVILFVAYALYTARQPAPQPIEIIPPEEVAATPFCTESPTIEASSPTATPTPLRVYVSGAVHAPGVYRLPPESLVVDAIEKAGGALDQADLVAINLAHPLADGEQIYVPYEHEMPAPMPISQASSPQSSEQKSGQPASSLIDLNTATQEELESLPGIGPAMAQRIMDGRPYSAVDDLLRVKGIGEAKLAKIRPYVTVR